MFNRKQHFRNSSLREVIVEHLFVGAALKNLWGHGVTDAEILRSEFDGFGYDLVLSRGDIVRHIQLKSGLSLKPVGISRILADKPSGCVIFLHINDLLEMGPYYWFGSVAGHPLPSLDEYSATRRSTPNMEGNKPERTNHRTVPSASFSKFNTLDEVMELLLGRIG